MATPLVIFEDDYLIVLDKPSGWITDSANTTTNQPVLQKWVADNFKFLINNYQFRNGIVHRLDKETSGVILIAKTEESLRGLQSQFKERLVSKTYTALVHGEVKLVEGMIDEPVGRLPWRRDRFGVLAGGRNAVTLYKVVEKYNSKGNHEVLTLLQLSPKTGRTHQLRIHLKHIGHPIVGDTFYAGRKTSRDDRMVFPRLFLHAGIIQFAHPVTHKDMQFNSPLPGDLSKPLESLVKIV
jgi:23S rRNA pseudouridine1911/1915/1917 synthase